MDTKAIRKRLAETAQSRRDEYVEDSHKYIQVAIPAEELRALLAEHCPKGWEHWREGLKNSDPLQCLFRLSEIDELCKTKAENVKRNEWPGD